LRYIGLDGSSRRDEDQKPCELERSMGSPAPIRVAVASDYRLFCDGIVQLLSEQSDLVVDACDPAVVPTLAGLVEIYDVVLYDAHALGDWPAAAAIPDAGGVILVGAPESDAWATAALAAGARGILTRRATREDVLHAVREVHRGGIWACRRWLNACVRHAVGRERSRLATCHDVETRLSRREREVLRSAASGLSNKELAERLAISEATVKVHLTRIFQKLGIKSRSALAAAYHGVRQTA